MVLRSNSLIFIPILMINIIMKLHELFPDEVDEGLAKWAGIAGLGAAAMFGNPGTTSSDDLSRPTAVSQPAAPATPALDQKKSPVAVPAVTTGTAKTADLVKQNFLRAHAVRAGMHGDELAAFLAQTAHETMGFHTMVERGDDAYFTNLYDIKGNPAKAAELGNVNAGDGARYKGRGFIHLTGRDNYRRAGTALKLPLEKHPELAAKPAVAARIALWFWKNRVRPEVRDWNDVRSVTHKINRGMQGLEDRSANYAWYRQALNIKTKT